MTLPEVQDRLGTLGVVRDGSGDPWGGLGRVGVPSRCLGCVKGPSARSETGQGSLPEDRDGPGNPPEARDRLGDPWVVRYRLGESPEGSRRVKGHSGRSGKGQVTFPVIWDGSGTLEEVQDGSVWDKSGDPWRDPGRVWGLSGKSETGWGTLPEVRDGSGDPPK